MASGPTDGSAVHGGGCCAAQWIVSPREERILRRLRALREQYRTLKSQGRGPARLESLRRQMRACRAEWREANQAKLRLLGHEV
jgi:chorismate mutase